MQQSMAPTQASGQAPLSGLYPMKAGLQLSDAIRFSYRYLESGQQDLTVIMS